VAFSYYGYPLVGDGHKLPMSENRLHEKNHEFQLALTQFFRQSSFVSQALHNALKTFYISVKNVFVARFIIPFGRITHTEVDVYVWESGFIVNKTFSIPGSHFIPPQFRFPIEPSSVELSTFKTEVNGGGLIL
jgi:hypothetical protein